MHRHPLGRLLLQHLPTKHFLNGRVLFQTCRNAIIRILYGFELLDLAFQIGHFLCQVTLYFFDLFVQLGYNLGLNLLEFI